MRVEAQRWMTGINTHGYRTHYCQGLFQFSLISTGHIVVRLDLDRGLGGVEVAQSILETKWCEVWKCIDLIYTLKFTEVQWTLLQYKGSLQIFFCHQTTLVYHILIGSPILSSVDTSVTLYQLKTSPPHPPYPGDYITLISSHIRPTKLLCCPFPTVIHAKGWGF